jgi:hypothetical protein
MAVDKQKFLDNNFTEQRCDLIALRHNISGQELKELRWLKYETMLAIDTLYKSYPGKDLSKVSLALLYILKDVVADDKPTSPWQDVLDYIERVRQGQEPKL